MIAQRNQGSRQSRTLRNVIHVFFAVAIAQSLAIPLEEKSLPDDSIVLDELVIENVKHPGIPQYFNWPFNVQYQSPQVRVRLVKSIAPPPGGWSYLKPYPTKRDAMYYYDANESATEVMDGQPEREERRYEEMVDEQTANRHSVDPEDETKNEMKGMIDDTGNPPVISSRNIINAPVICPVGQRKDRKGICRPVVKM